LPIDILNKKTQILSGFWAVFRLSKYLTKILKYAIIKVQRKNKSWHWFRERPTAINLKITSSLYNEIALFNKKLYKEKKVKEFSVQIYPCWPGKGRVENFSAETAEEARKYCEKYFHPVRIFLIGKVKVEFINLYQRPGQEEDSKLWKWSPGMGWRRSVGAEYLPLSVVPDDMTTDKYLASVQQMKQGVLADIEEAIRS
jgi:hypothetical protein